MFCFSGDARANEKKKEWSGEGYRIEMTDTSACNDGCTVNAIVSNDSQEEIRNWAVVLTKRQGILTNVWNADCSSPSGETYILESKDYNMVISEGESKSFGFQMKDGSLSDIESVQLVKGSKGFTNDLSFVWKETGSWQNHKNIEIQLKNESSHEVRDWEVSFQMKGKINHIWGAVVLSGDHEKYRIKNADYNAVIKAGQTVTFGMQIEYEGDVFSGIRDVLLYDSQWKRETVMPTTSPVVTTQPTTTQPATSQPATSQPATTQPMTSQPTNLPTDAPKETTTPENTVVPTKVPQVETEEIEEGDACFFPVENREWNMDMIRAKDSKVKKAKANPNRKIKVTMLDSGINYSSEVEVKERKNFLGEYEEMNCLYEDESGHGTAIAEILASNPEKAKEEKKDSDVVETEQGTYTYYDQEEEEKLPEETMQSNLEEGDATLMDLLDSGYEWNEGVNPSIELYSGKILDENNETTVDLVVEGIDWAIEKESDLLCLSIGMEKGSEKLHEAVKRAKKAGILIVSAVGEGDKADYPAAYPEVLSVGMTDSM